jgi:hypothetical protein
MKPRDGAGRVRPAALIAAALVAVCLAAPAIAAEANWLNVDCFIGWEGCYRPNDWVSVDINITPQKLKEAFDGVLMVTGDQDEQSAMTVVRKFVLTPDVPLSIPLVTRLGGLGADCNVTIQDDATKRTVKELVYRSFDPQTGSRSRQAVGGADVLIGVSRPEYGATEFGLGKLGQAAQADRNWTPGSSSETAANLGVQRNEHPGTVYVKEKLQRRLPWDWTGYACLDLLILCDPDWTAFTPEQSAAVVQWVTGGGRLLIIMGTHPLPADHPIAAMLPLKVGPSRKVTLPTGSVLTWGCDMANEWQDVTAWSLEDVDWTFEEYGTGQPLFAYGQVGFGRAAVLAFDPSSLKLRPGATPASFWIWHTDKLLSHRLFLGVVNDSANWADAYIPALDSAARDGSSQAGEAVMNYLLDIPQMRPISIIWIILLLFGLAMVIGPIDYFVLKRLDRLPLTWLTFTFYIVAFSVAAYFGVKALRSGQTQLRAVSVVDAVDGRAGAWSSCYSGIFAPESDDYRLSGLGRGQWWSAFSPLATNYDYYSERRPTRRMTCVQKDGGNLPQYLPINIWSMQYMLDESAAAQAPIAAKVERDGDGLGATIENLTDSTISYGWIESRAGRSVMFEALGPRETRSVLLGPPRANYTYDSAPRALMATNNIPPYLTGACCARGTVGRTRAIDEAVEKGGAVLVTAVFEQSPPGFGLADRSFEVTHAMVARLLVPPERIGKGAQHD